MKIQKVGAYRGIKERTIEYDKENPIGGFSDLARPERHRRGLLRFVPQLKKTFFQRLASSGLGSEDIKLLNMSLRDIEQKHFQTALDNDRFYDYPHDKILESVQNKLLGESLPKLQKMNNAVNAELGELDRILDGPEATASSGGWVHYYVHSARAFVMLAVILRANIAKRIEVLEAEKR